MGKKSNTSPDTFLPPQKTEEMYHGTASQNKKNKNICSVLGAPTSHLEKRGDTEESESTSTTNSTHIRTAKLFTEHRDVFFTPRETEVM